MAEKIKLVVFDLEEVVIDTWHKLPDAVPELKRFSYEFLERNLYGRENPDHFPFYMGRMKEEAFWRNAIGRLQLKTGVEELESAVRRFFVELPGTLDFVKELRKRYKTALLSNFPNEWFDYVSAKLSFNDAFDACFNSGRTGLLKPDEKSYLNVLKRFRVKPHECVFIDDKERNTKAAEKLGIRVILFRGLPGLREALKSLLKA